MPPIADDPIELTLRPARASDVRLLHRWVNQPDSLAAKLRTTQPVPFDRHREWFAARLARDDVYLLIAEADGRPVGQVRFEPGEDGYEIDIYVDAPMRRRGLGARLLRDALARLRAERPDARVRARIRRENVASRRLFEGCGFALSGDTPADHVILEHRGQNGAVP